MKASKSGKDPAKPGGNLRNFDLSVEEIKILRAIEDLRRALVDLESSNSPIERLDYFRDQILQLEEKLDEIRDHTLIR